MVESSLMHHPLLDLHRELESIEIKEKDHQRLLSLAQHEIEKVQKDKADVTQKTDKFVKEEAKVDFDRTAKKRIDAKSLAILK
jgi:hypothetical protein